MFFSKTLDTQDVTGTVVLVHVHVETYRYCALWDTGYCALWDTDDGNLIHPISTGTVDLPTCADTCKKFIPTYIIYYI